MLLKVAPTIQVVAKGWGQKGIIISTEFNWMTTKPSPLDWQEDLYGGRLAKQVHASMIVCYTSFSEEFTRVLLTAWLTSFAC